MPSSFFIWSPRMRNRVLRPQRENLDPSLYHFFCLFLFSFSSFLLFLGFSFSDENYTPLPIRVEDGQELSQSHSEMDLGLDQSFFHAKLGMGRGFPHTIGGRSCARIFDKIKFSALRDCTWLLLVICARSRYKLLLVCFMIHDSKDLNL